MTFLERYLSVSYGLQLKNQYTSAEYHLPSLVAAYTALTSTVNVRCSASTCVESSVYTPSMLGWGSKRWLMASNPILNERNLSVGKFLPEFQKLVNFQFQSVRGSVISPLVCDSALRVPSCTALNIKNNKQKKKQQKKHTNKHTQNQNTNYQNKQTKNTNYKNKQQYYTHQKSLDVSAARPKFDMPFLRVDFIGKKIDIQDAHQNRLLNAFKRIWGTEGIVKPSKDVIGYHECSRPATGIVYLNFADRFFIKVKILVSCKKSIYKVLKIYSHGAFLNFIQNMFNPSQEAPYKILHIVRPSDVVADCREAVKRFKRYLERPPPVFCFSE